jgi:hypothetical protein
MKNKVLLISAILAALLLSSCANSSSPAIETVVVTVVNTVPVEITRIVEVEKTVEVTRQVVVTQEVEVPVTVTPSPTPENSPTPESTATPTAPAFITAEATPTFPQEKVEGFSFLKLVNETDNNLVVNISGPFQQSYPIGSHLERVETVKEGQYTYMVLQDGRVIFRGTMNFTNPDKHELHIREDKVVFLVP